MKKLLWTGALALTAMVCLTACGDDDSGTSAGGDDELITCDITDKKVVVKENAGEYSVTQTYTHNEDGTMTSRYEYGPGHKNVCDGPMPTEVDDEDVEMTCKDNVLTVKTKEAVTTREFQGYAGAATAVCPEPASWGKDTKPSDDDDEAGTDDDGEGSDGDGDSTDTPTENDQGGSTGTDDDDDEGLGNGGETDFTCNFKKSDDTWVLEDGALTIKWDTGKAVAIVKSDMGDAESCQMILGVLALDAESEGSSSCDGSILLMEDPDSYKDLSREAMYDMYCVD
ncbi:MAG: hypothetical protein K6E57_08505 [Fibrobacter sp.]|nr:hypothetical protein [Fibrobacter sp.]